MPQTVQPPVGGLQIAQGANGPVFLFAGYGSPNLSTATSQVQTASQGSLYCQIDGADTTHTLWVCTTSGVPATPQGLPAVAAVWTNK